MDKVQYNNFTKCFVGKIVWLMGEIQDTEFLGTNIEEIIEDYPEIPKEKLLEAKQKSGEWISIT